VLRGVIDIGSNSIKLVVGEADKKDIRVLSSLKNIVPMGQYAFLSGEIPQELMNQSVAVLQKYRQVLREHGLDHAFTFATTAIREARNRDIFMDTVFRKTGFKVEILAVGDVVYYIDSYLSYTLKNSYPIHAKNILIAELGAGAIDLSMMRKGFTLLNAGLPLGTLRLKQLFNRLDGTLEENYEAIEEYIERELSSFRRNLHPFNIDDLILIDETYSPYINQFMKRGKRKPAPAVSRSEIAGLSVKTAEEDDALPADERFFPVWAGDIDAMVREMKGKTGEEIERDFDLPAEISDRVTMHGFLLAQLLKLIQKGYLYIFETSLAEAVLAELLLGRELRKKYDRTNQLIAAAKFLCQKYNADTKHAQHVAELSGTIFEAVKDMLGLKREEKIYLTLAAHLHDLGTFVHNRAHHKHTEYLLSALSLFRLSDEEMKIVACVSRYHRGNAPSPAHPLYVSLSQENRILVQKLCSVLRMANALDRTHKQKVKKFDALLGEHGELVLGVVTHHNFILERLDLMDKKDLFENLAGSRVLLQEKGQP
jgi:exopolyphosphatase/guanosine-5'-triphosphate,3'-diphosphate pyrophosphatase